MASFQFEEQVILQRNFTKYLFRYRNKTPHRKKTGAIEPNIFHTSDNLLQIRTRNISHISSTSQLTMKNTSLLKLPSIYPLHLAIPLGGARTSMSIRSNHHGIGHPSHHEIENTMIVLCCCANEYCIPFMIPDSPVTL